MWSLKVSKFHLEIFLAFVLFFNFADERFQNISKLGDNAGLRVFFQTLIEIPLTFSGK